MEPILISLSVCVVGVMAAVSLFSVAMRGREGGEAQPSGGLSAPAGKFFLEESADPEARPYRSTEALLLQLERHFRLEQQAAASFLEGPSVESLHAPSSSPLRD